MLASIIAGQTLTYRVSGATYPAQAGWAVKLYLSPRAGGVVVGVEADGDGNDHVFSVPAATTADWLPGWYGFEVWAALGVDAFRVEAGQVRIVGGLAGATNGGDTRSDAQRALDDAKAAFIAWSPTTREYMIAGRQVTFNSAAEIVAKIRYFEAEVKREQAADAIAAGIATGRKVYVRMGRG